MFDDVILAFLILFGLTILVIIPNIKIVRENEVSIVERLGKYLKTLQGPGIFFIVPLIDRTIETIYLGKQSIKESMLLGTDDKITYHIDYVIKDPKAYTYIALNAKKEFKKDMHELILNQGYNQISLDLLNEYSEAYGIEVTDYVIL